MTKGKYNNSLDEFASEVLLLNGCDEESAPISDAYVDWYGLINFSDEDRLIAQRLAQDISRYQSVIIHEDEQGFVNCEWFEDMAKASEEWQGIVSNH